MLLPARNVVNVQINRSRPCSSAETRLPAHINRQRPDEFRRVDRFHRRVPDPLDGGTPTVRHARCIAAVVFIRTHRLCLSSFSDESCHD